MSELLIEIPVRPLAKQRARTVNGHTYTPPRTRAYENAIASYARVGNSVRGQIFPEGDLELELTLCSKKQLRGDIDNYAKAVMDGLVKSGVVADDGQFKKLVVWMRSRVEDDLVWIRIRDLATISEDAVR